MRWKGVLVLNYHRIGAPQVGFDAELWSATPQELDEQFEILARDFDVVGPDDLAERPQTQGRRVLVTFDDGYRDNYEQALPALRRHGLVATFFVVPAFIDRPRVAWWDEIAWIISHSECETESAADILSAYKGLPGDRTQAYIDDLAERCGTSRCPAELAEGLWMTWDEVREIRDAGSFVGGHSLSHPVLARLSPDEQEAEISTCAQRLREELDTDMRWFSYPVGLPGTFDGTTRGLLAAEGVELAFAFAGGYSPRGVTDRLAIPRTAVSFDMSHARFSATLRAPWLFARW